MVRLRSPAPILRQSFGGIPERPKGADCKSVVTDFAGPNPASPTKNKKPTFESVFCFCRGKRFRSASLSPTRIWFVLFRVSRCQLASIRHEKKPRVARIQGFPVTFLRCFRKDTKRCPFCVVRGKLFGQPPCHRQGSGSFFFE